MSESIKGIRLTSGDEVIGKYDSETHTIKDPIQIMPTPDGRIAMIPWCFYGDIDNGIQINPSTIIYEVKPTTEMINAYRERTSGLVVASESPVGVVGSIGAD